MDLSYNVHMVNLLYNTNDGERFKTSESVI